MVLSASSESIYQTKQNRARGSSIRHRSQRSSSRRNKENGSGSFRRKNSSKKAITENVFTLKFQNNSVIDSAQNRTQVVSYGDIPMVFNMKNLHSIQTEQEHSSRDQNFPSI